MYILQGSKVKILLNLSIRSLGDTKRLMIRDYLDNKNNINWNKKLIIKWKELKDGIGIVEIVEGTVEFRKH